LLLALVESVQMEQALLAVLAAHHHSKLVAILIQQVVDLAVAMEALQ
jgi:hypothetical protein